MSQDRHKPLPDLMTVDEVAEMLRATPKTIREAIKAGQLPAVKPLGTWRVRRSDVEELIARTSTDHPGDRALSRGRRREPRASPAPWNEGLSERAGRLEGRPASISAASSSEHSPSTLASVMAEVDPNVVLSMPLRTILRTMLNSPEPVWASSLSNDYDLPWTTVKNCLRRLERAGWVTSEKESPEEASERKLGARRFYQLTPDGRQLATERLAARRGRSQSAVIERESLGL